MTTTLTPVAAPPAPAGDGRLAPRVVFFGPPRSGKTSLIQAFLRALDPGGDRTTILTPDGPPGALRRELVPHTLRVDDPALGPAGAVVVCDCDGQAAGDLLAHPDALVRGAARGALADAVRAADALVLVVDAASSEAEVERLFSQFKQFVDGLDDQRTFGREVGGLPVFLTLTKCDRLARPGDAPADWAGQIEARKADLAAQFQDYFGDDPGAESPYLEFGSTALSVAATALAPPAGPGFPADPAGTVGVDALARAVLPAAVAFRERVLRGRQRLRMTVTGVGVVVATLVLGAVTMATTAVGPADRLADRVRAYRAREGPPAVRLSDRTLPRNLRELESVRGSPVFADLPAELREYVENRLAEVGTYKEYRGRFLPPRVGPPDVRSQEELGKLAADLDGELAPPPGYAREWADTEAVRLRAKWRADIPREAEARLHDWYRGLTRTADGLALSESPPDAGWRARAVGVVRAADAPPFRPADPVPGSPAVPVRRGGPLAYAPAFEFDRIDVARRDWETAKTRLSNLRDLCDALGLTAGPGTPPAVLDLPPPGWSVEDSLALGPARLRALSDAFPRPPLKHPEWAASNFPDPARRWLEPRLRAAADAGARHVRRVLAARAGGDRPADWRRLADAVTGDQALTDWGHLLGLLRRWADSAPPPLDPVRELADFLRRESFPVALTAVEVTVPDDLLVPRGVPAGRFVLGWAPADGPAREWAFRPDGDGRRDRGATVYRFAADGPPARFEYRPGDRLSAALPLRSGGDDYRLVWAGGRSAAYQFDRLADAPTLEKVGPIPAPEPAPGVRVRAEPAGGLPAVPGLFPGGGPS